MLIILEGPDGSGKSTSAKRLEELIHERFPGSEVVHGHRGPPTSTNWLDEYLEPLARYRPNTGQHLILDRWHWGEKVYPHIVGRPTLFTHSSEWWYLEAFLRSRGALVIFFDGTARFHAARVIERAVREGDPKVPSLAPLTAELELQGGLFARAAKQSRLNRTIFFTGKPLNLVDQTLSVAVDLASNLEQGVAPLVAHPTYVGPRWPTHLILGDQRGPGRLDIPVAFAPMSGTSGHFLLRALPERWLADNDIGIANACEDEDLDDLVTTLEYPKMIVLGREAANETKRFKRATMPHPQWCRRFYYTARDRYGETLVEALEEQEEALTWRP